MLFIEMVGLGFQCLKDVTGEINQWLNFNLIIFVSTRWHISPQLSQAFMSVARWFSLRKMPQGFFGNPEHLTELFLYFVAGKERPYIIGSLVHLVSVLEACCFFTKMSSGFFASLECLPEILKAIFYWEKRLHIFWSSPERLPGGSRLLCFVKRNGP